MDAPIDRLLLLQTRWMGDVLLCTPAIREARHAFPDARIDFVTEAPGAQVLAENPYVDGVLVDRRTVRSRIALMKQIASTRYDAVVDFRTTNSTTSLALASGAPLRVGVRGRGPRKWVYHHLVARITPDVYAARHKLDMLGPIGVPVQYINDLSLDLPINRFQREEADRFWREHQLAEANVVAMTPISRERYKQWEPSRWAAVADALIADGHRVLMTSGPGERERVEEIVEVMSREPVWDFTTESVQALGALIERCSLWVGNDGGAKHVAAAVGVPTLAVIRWTLGEMWTDSGSAVGQIYIEEAPPGGCDLRCSRCSHLGCLDAIPIERVLETARTAIAAAGR